MFYLYLKIQMESKYLLLENINTFNNMLDIIKNKQVAVELSEDHEWECLCYNENVRNGFVVFKRKDI